MRALSLHHMSLLDMPVTELVDTAAELGCAHVCVFTQQPPDGGGGMPAIGDADVKQVKMRMTRAGITAYCMTSFPLLPDTDPTGYRAALERGAQLGATRASLRFCDTDEQRLVDNLSAVDELCRELGILPSVEFTGFANPDALPQVLRVIARAGCGRVTLDPLHIARSGTPWVAIEALDRNLIGCVQICDGPAEGTATDYAHEQAFDRMMPGEGAFPLARLLAASPPELPLSLEIPCTSLRDQGLGPRDRAREIVGKTRAYLQAFDRNAG